MVRHFVEAMKRKTSTSGRKEQAIKSSRKRVAGATSKKNAGRQQRTALPRCQTPKPKNQPTNGLRTRMAIKTSSAKAKGRKLQQWTRNLILKLVPTLEPDDVKSTSMGASGEDVQLSPQARKKLPITIECKARKSIAVYSYYDQALTNAPTGMEPIVIIKADRKKPLAIVDAEFFFEKMVKK